MRILVVLLARLGDTYLAWPALRALRRKYPHARIEVVTRERFAAALDGIGSCVDAIHVISTKEILEPLIRLEAAPADSFAAMKKFCTSVRSGSGFDLIVNWSFSPFSSYFSSAMARPFSSANAPAQVIGYARTTDGFLAIPDDIGAYFYAQVGVGRSNRFHLIELMASQLSVDLQEDDFLPPPRVSLELFPDLPSEYLVLHVGASQADKTLSASRWISVLSHLRSKVSLPCVIIGSKEEQEVGNTISSSLPESQVVNLVGRTSLREVFALLQGAKLLVGGDSAPLHMATLTSTRTLNLSASSRVNFWETGPRAPGSAVLLFESEADVSSDQIANAISAMINSDFLPDGLIPCLAGTPSYLCETSPESEFEWNLVRAIYQEQDFPALPSATAREGLRQLNEVNRMLQDQLRAVDKGVPLERVVGLLQRGEEIIETIAKLVPQLQVIVRWYQTEKLRIGPGTPQEVLERTSTVQALLQKIVDLYMDHEKSANKGAQHESP